MNHINSFTCWQIVFKLRVGRREGMRNKRKRKRVLKHIRHIHFSRTTNWTHKNCEKFVKRCDTIQSNEKRATTMSRPCISYSVLTSKTTVGKNRNFFIRQISVSFFHFPGECDKMKTGEVSCGWCVRRVGRENLPFVKWEAKNENLIENCLRRD